MDLLEFLQDRLLTAVCWWVGLGAAFFVLTKLWPCNAGRSWWKAPWAALTDFAYGLFLPVLGVWGRVALLCVGAAALYGRGAAPEFTARAWPLWVQCLLVLLIQDALMYWAHRLFHTRRGWAFHAVHHSPETVDWTSAVRFHPVNELAQYALADAAVLLMGFSPLSLVAMAPFHSVYSALVHANLKWTFGPLRYVLASPVFHRWHHSSQREALGKNFAPTFPILDLIWGTFYMPRGVLPESYGANEPEMPAGPLGQTLFPFRGAGRWARRRPAFAAACVVACAGAGYSSWQYLSRPDEARAEASPAPCGAGGPPELLPADVLQAPRQANAVAVDATGRRAVYAQRDGSVLVRDIATGREWSPGRHTARVNAVATSPGGRWAVSASSDGTALAFDEENHAGRALPHGVTNVRCVAASDDGWVATGASDGVLRLWGPGGELTKQRGLDSGPIDVVAVSDGGRRVVAGQGTQVTTWEVATDRLTRHQRLGDLAYCVGVSGDGRRVVAGEYTGRLLVWDAGEERPRLVAKGHAGPIYSLWVNADGGTVVTGGADGTVRVWDANGAATQELRAPSGLIFAVSYGVRGGRIVAGGKDGSITTWDVPGGAVVPATRLQPAKPGHE